MRRLSTRSEHDVLMDEEEHYRRFLDEKVQTIRFFEGMGKPLSTREVEILLEEDEDRSNTFLFGDGKEGGFEGLDLVSVDDKRACVECRYFCMGHFSAYCYEFHHPQEVDPRDLACRWFKGRG